MPGNHLSTVSLLINKPELLTVFIVVPCGTQKIGLLNPKLNIKRYNADLTVDEVEASRSLFLPDLDQLSPSWQTLSINWPDITMINVALPPPH